MRKNIYLVGSIANNKNYEKEYEKFKGMLEAKNCDVLTNCLNNLEEEKEMAVFYETNEKSKNYHHKRISYDFSFISPYEINKKEIEGKDLKGLEREIELAKIDVDLIKTCDCVVIFPITVEKTEYPLYLQMRNSIEEIARIYKKDVLQIINEKDIKEYGLILEENQRLDSNYFVSVVEEFKRRRSSPNVSFHFGKNYLLEHIGNEGDSINKFNKNEREKIYDKVADLEEDLNSLDEEERRRFNDILNKMGTNYESLLNYNLEFKALNPKKVGYTLTLTEGLKKIGIKTYILEDKDFNKLVRNNGSYSPLLYNSGELKSLESESLANDLSEEYFNIKNLNKKKDEVKNLEEAKKFISNIKASAENKNDLLLARINLKFSYKRSKNLLNVFNGEFAYGFVKDDCLYLRAEAIDFNFFEASYLPDDIISFEDRLRNIPLEMISSAYAESLLNDYYKEDNENNISSLCDSILCYNQLWLNIYKILWLKEENLRDYYEMYRQYIHLNINENPKINQTTFINLGNKKAFKLLYNEINKYVESIFENYINEYNSQLIKKIRKESIIENQKFLQENIAPIEMTSDRLNERLINIDMSGGDREILNGIALIPGHFAIDNAPLFDMIYRKVFEKLGLKEQDFKGYWSIYKTIQESKEKIKGFDYSYKFK